MKTHFALRGYLSGLLVLAAGFCSCYGSLITVPSGLNPGDQYRLAFVTSTNHASSSSDIGFYNDAVSSQANTVPELAALGAVWTAIGSTSTIDARDNTNTNPNLSAGLPIYLLNDTLLANDNADLWDGSIANPLNVDELGSLLPLNNSSANRVSTGTQADGTVLASRELGTLVGARLVGDARLVDGRWVHNGILDTAIGAHLYAVSDPITVAVPEASEALVILLGMTGLMGVRRRRG